MQEKKQGDFFHSLDSRFSRLEKQVAAKTRRTLRRMKRQEERLYRKLYAKDSVAAKRIFSGLGERYAMLESKVAVSTATGIPGRYQEYTPFYDTILTGLSFIGKRAGDSAAIAFRVAKCKQSVVDFGSRMAVANEIKSALADRKKILQEHVNQLGLGKYLKDFNKEVYYYRRQLEEYKSMLDDPKKIEQKAISLLRNTEGFKGFMRKYGMLSQIFSMPEDDVPIAGAEGLQTRAGLQAVLNQRFAGGGVSPRQYIRQQMQQAEGEIAGLKNKIAGIKNSSSQGDIEMPQGFKPNNQKTKSFLQRLEYGTNFQTQKLNSYFPVTTDIGLSIGYKLNDKSVIGIGASYKLGWGNGIEHLRLTSEGLGLRSYVDLKLKGSFWMTGGYEQNYLQRFAGMSQLQDLSRWKQSALAGISKKLKIGKKKESKVQLLYDFFYKAGMPAQPLVFRVGYGF